MSVKYIEYTNEYGEKCIKTPEERVGDNIHPLVDYGRGVSVLNVHDKGFFNYKDYIIYIEKNINYKTPHAYIVSNVEGWKIEVDTKGKIRKIWVRGQRHWLDDYEDILLEYKKWLLRRHAYKDKDKKTNKELLIEWWKGSQY
jgi:hypothetical protein